MAGSRLAVGAKSIGSDGNDVFAYANPAEFRSLKGLDGAGGVDTLHFDFSTNLDLRRFEIESIEKLELTASGNGITLAGPQAAGLSSIEGGTGFDSIRMELTPQPSGSLDLSGVTFKSIESVYVNGTYGNDSVTGSAAGDIVLSHMGNDSLSGGFGNDTLVGGIGKDSLDGGEGNDLFAYMPGLDIVAGEQIVGGAGYDTIRLDFSGAVQLHLLQISGVEKLDLGADGHTVTLTAEQLAGFSEIVGGYRSDVLSLAGLTNTIDVSGTTFANIDALRLRAGDELTAGGAGIEGLKAIVGSATSKIGNVLKLSGNLDLSKTALELVGSGKKGALLATDKKWSVEFGDAGVERTLTLNGGDAKVIGRITGGSGTDTVKLAAADTVLDLRHVTLSGVDTIDFGNGVYPGITRVVFLNAGHLGSLSRIQGGNGVDVLNASLTTPGVMDLSAVAVDNVEKIILAGSAGADVLVGTVRGDEIGGGQGNDSLNAGGGDDTLSGGGGADTLWGGQGNDVFVYATAQEMARGEVLDGGSGYDALRFGFSGMVDLSAIDLSEIEELWLSAGGNSVTLTAAQIAKLQAIHGGAKADTVLLAGADNQFDIGGVSFGEIDVLRLRAGDELTAGGTKAYKLGSIVGTATATAGNVLKLSADLDLSITTLRLVGSGKGGTLTATDIRWTVEFGHGGQTLTLNSADAAVIGKITGGAGTDTLKLAGADDLLDLSRMHFSQIETIDLGGVAAGETSHTLLIRGGQLAGVTTLKSDHGLVKLNLVTAGDLDLSTIGLSGIKTVEVTGSSGADKITGTAMNDRISGGAGNDSIRGGTGTDALAGGAGQDRFIYGGLGEGGDTILDFVSGVDALVFSGSGFGLGAKGGIDKSQFVANATGTATTASEIFVFNTTSRSLWFDADGSGEGKAVLIGTFGSGVVNYSDILVAGI